MSWGTPIIDGVSFFRIEGGVIFFLFLLSHIGAQIPEGAESVVSALWRVCGSVVKSHFVAGLIIACTKRKTPPWYPCSGTDSLALDGAPGVGIKT